MFCVSQHDMKYCMATSSNAYRLGLFPLKLALLQSCLALGVGMQDGALQAVE
jgi:hypothetical protein